jgi:hypothetical protein
MSAQSLCFPVQTGNVCFTYTPAQNGLNTTFSFSDFYDQYSRPINTALGTIGALAALSLGIAAASEYENPNYVTIPQGFRGPL